MTDVFSILLVCTGNIARSAMGERLLAVALAGEPSLRVSSAGTWGHTGSAMERHAAAALAEIGVDERGFRARELTPTMVQEADLVLAATRGHRAAALAHQPAALRRTFTLRELARLVQHCPVRHSPHDTPVERARSVVAAAAAGRGSVRVPAHEDDLDDPYGAGLAVYRCRRDQIAEASNTVAAALLPSPP